MRKLEYFVATVETGSFSNAAKKLYVSASAINQQITALESDINVELFDRSNYRPILTPSGRLFYDDSKKILKAYYGAIDAARLATNVLRVGPIGPVESHLLPTLIADYKAQSTDIEFELKQGSFRLMREGLLNHSIDVAFGIEDDFKVEGIKITLLKSLQMVVVCSKNHPLAKENSVSGKQLEDYPLVILSRKTGDYFYTNMFKSFELDDVRPEIVGTYDNVDALLTAVRIQQGIAVLSREVINSMTDIVLIDLVNTHHHSTYCVAQNESSSLKSDLFVSFVLESFQKNPKL